jgi:hypothetical protein
MIRVLLLSFEGRGGKEPKAQKEMMEDGKS